MTKVTTPHIIEGAALARAIPNVTLPQLIRERAGQHPDDIALIDAASGPGRARGGLQATRRHRALRSHPEKPGGENFAARAAGAGRGAWGGLVSLLNSKTRLQPP